MDLLAWDDSGDHRKKYKQAILHVAHGIELLLKEKLRRLHPSLIWENVDKYPNLNARTVSVEQAMTRLRNIGNIEISEADSSLIRSIRNTRNAIEHFRWETTKSEAIVIVGNGLGLCAHFAKIHLGHDVFGYAYKKDDTWKLLIEKSQRSSKPTPRGTKPLRTWEKNTMYPANFAMLSLSSRQVAHAPYVDIGIKNIWKHLSSIMKYRSRISPNQPMEPTR